MTHTTHAHIIERMLDLQARMLDLLQYGSGADLSSLLTEIEQAEDAPDYDDADEFDPEVNQEDEPYNADTYDQAPMQEWERQLMEPQEPMIVRSLSPADEQVLDRFITYARLEDEHPDFGGAARTVIVIAKAATARDAGPGNLALTPEEDRQIQTLRGQWAALSETERASLDQALVDQALAIFA